MCKKLMYLVLVVFASGVVLTSPAGAELVGWWKLDETSGTVAADSSGNGLDGTLTGGGTWVAGQLGGAWQGDGSDDYIELGDPAALDLSGAGQATITAWANVAVTKNHNSILTKGEWRDAYSLLVKGDTSPPNRLWTGNNTSVFSADPVPLNEWTHVAVTISGDLTNFYINGTLNGPADQDRGEPIDNPARNAAIGREDRSGSDPRWYFNGMLDDVRVYNEALPEEQIQAIMLGRDMGAQLAINPGPADGAADVPFDVVLSWAPGEFAAKHDVYLGASFDDVNAAEIGADRGVLASEGQTDSTYQPLEPLEFGATYYWRVDEVNAPPDGSIFKGTVWSFTVEPYAYPIENIVASASSSSADMGPEKTVDGSGLNDADEHSKEDVTMWLSQFGAAEPTWIQYEFDRVYKLDEMWVWNFNQGIEPYVGFGVKDAMIEYSADGETWTTLEGVPEFTRAAGKDGYVHDTTVDFGGVSAKLVKLTCTDNWGALSQYGLSEVRFFHVPVQARGPEPADGATGVELDVALNWRPGREAVSHEVYFSDDAEAVAAGTAPMETLDEHRFDVTSLDFGTAYSWKVDEVGEAASYPGEVWSFTTKEYAVIDDFESYNDDVDAGTTIFDTWIDGLTNNTGSLVGYWEAPFAEQTVVHGGKQSMPLDYNNVVSPWYSEAYRDFSVAQNWTVNGSDTFVLYFRGRPLSFLEPAPGSIIMSGEGTDIYGTADQFRFVYKSLSGDGSIVARVESLDDTHDWAKVGVMIRESLDPGSRFAIVCATPANGVRYQARLLNLGGATSDTPVATPEQMALQTPVWVKVERSGDEFNGYYSTDGATWTAMSWNPQTISMMNSAYIGLAVTSHASGVSCTGEFSGITTSGGVSGSWQTAEIGVAQPSNTPAPLYVVVEDSSSRSKAVTHPDESATVATDWQSWAIPLDEFRSGGVDVTKVKRLYIGVGDRANPQAGGAGLLYIDDIGFGHPAE